MLINDIMKTHNIKPQLQFYPYMLSFYSKYGCSKIKKNEDKP